MAQDRPGLTQDCMPHPRTAPTVLHWFEHVTEHAVPGRAPASASRSPPLDITLRCAQVYGADALQRLVGYGDMGFHPGFLQVPYCATLQNLTVFCPFFGAFYLCILPSCLCILPSCLCTLSYNHTRAMLNQELLLQAGSSGADHLCAAGIFPVFCIHSVRCAPAHCTYVFLLRCLIT